MEILLAIVIFGILLAITLYGYIQSERIAREREMGNFRSSSNFAMTSGGRERQDSPTSPSE